MQPDIEIYVKNLELDELNIWLEKSFDFEETITTSAQVQSITLDTGSRKIQLMITMAAAGKAYTSLWFKSNDTPWKDDKDCAESYLQVADTEVRCSAASWQESEAEFSEKWWKLTRNSSELVSWA